MVISVSIVYSPHEQVPCLNQTLTLPEGSTVLDALQAARLFEQFPEARNLSIGIHSKIVSLAQVLEPDARIEIYRPLNIDPKLARRQRARLR